MFDHDDGNGNTILAINEGKQAVNQLIASVLTFAIAIVGGSFTGKLSQKYTILSNLKLFINYKLFIYGNHLSMHACFRVVFKVRW